MTLPDQPISAREVISNSLKLYFKNLGSLSKIALLWIFPAFMLMLFGEFYEQSFGRYEFLYDLLASILLITLLFLSWGVIAYFTANTLLGKKVTLRQCSQAAWQWFFPLLQTSISYGLLFSSISYGLLLFASGVLVRELTYYGPLTTLGVLLAAILCFLLAIWFASCIPVCIIEKKSPLESFKRSKFLVDKNMWHVSKVFILSLLLFFGVAAILFVILVLLFVVTVIVTVILLIIPILLAKTLPALLARGISAASEVESLFQSITIVELIIHASFSLLLTIMFPFLPIVFTLLYLNLRTRKEAFDREVLTKDLSRYDFAS